MIPMDNLARHPIRRRLVARRLAQLADAQYVASRDLLTLHCPLLADAVFRQGEQTMALKQAVDRAA